MGAVVALNQGDEDQRVVLSGKSWQDYEALLAMRGDQAGVLLPNLDLSWLLSFLEIEPQSQAVRALRDALRG